MNGSSVIFDTISQINFWKEFILIEAVLYNLISEIIIKKIIGDYFWIHA